MGEDAKKNLEKFLEQSLRELAVYSRTELAIKIDNYYLALMKRPETKHDLFRHRAERIRDVQDIVISLHRKPQQ